MKLVAWFREVDRGDIGLVGGKGANLGELTGAGIPVPPGFILTAQAYFRFLEESDLKTNIEGFLTGLNVDDSSELQRVAAAVKEAIKGIPLPADVAAEITRAYREMGSGLVAVRSSATAEDLAEASFAGQQSTYLNVEGEQAVVNAVQDCWASLFEARAIFYRAHASFDHLSVGIAVVIQRMVQSERSGVMFTVEPVSGNRDKIVIEALYGLGEAVVSGALTPDMYVVDKESDSLSEKTVAYQDQQMIRNPKVGEGDEYNIWTPVPAAEAGQQKLKDSEIVSLARLGRRIEHHYDAPQDIEWAEESGELYIVQSRPVTTTARATERSEAEQPTERAPILLDGSPASPGVGVGRVKIIPDPSQIDRIEEGDILVAEMTTPDFVPAMKRAAGIVTDRGGRTCHAAIVSRELETPCVVGAKDATKKLFERQQVTVDGSQGRVYEGRAEARLAWAEEEKTRWDAAASIQTKTKVYVNLAERSEAKEVAKANVDGVGLLRAEFIIADHVKEHPRLCLEEGRPDDFTNQLADALRDFAAAFSPRPVIYRTTDFKTNEYRGLKGGEKYEALEENPMIGFRGASRYIRDEEVFHLEIKAIQKVREQYPNLWVMIPFVRTSEELARVKALMERFGLVRSPDFKLWMMAEVPSNVFLLDRFIDVGIDGISIGSNDLTQLILGIDRDNSQFATEFDERNEAVMQALERLVTGAKKRGVTVSICGQAPSDYPEITQKLVEWGITSVSVNRDVINKMRQIVADAEDAQAALEASSLTPATTSAS